MAVLDAANVEIVFLDGDQITENVFAVQATHPLSEPDANAIDAVVRDWIDTTLQPLQAANVRHLAIRVKGVNHSDPSFDYPGLGTLGTAAGVSLPNHVTFSIKKNTALSGRAYRGRFYHIGLTNDMLETADRNIVNSTTVFALISTYAALMTALATAGHPMQILQKDYTVDPPVYKTQVPVISITAADNKIDSQRRRLPGRGR